MTAYCVDDAWPADFSATFVTFVFKVLDQVFDSFAVIAGEFKLPVAVPYVAGQSVVVNLLYRLRELWYEVSTGLN